MAGPNKKMQIYLDKMVEPDKMLFAGVRQNVKRRDAVMYRVMYRYTASAEFQDEFFTNEKDAIVYFNKLVTDEMHMPDPRWIEVEMAQYSFSRTIAREMVISAS